MIIEKITDFGGSVIPGSPAVGDIVRITTESGFQERRWSETDANPVSNTPPEYKPLTSSQFLTILASTVGFERADVLLKANGVIEALILKADRIERHLGNTPAAIAFLKTIFPNPLTDAELAGIESTWKALT